MKIMRVREFVNDDNEYVAAKIDVDNNGGDGSHSFDAELTIGEGKYAFSHYLHSSSYYTTEDHSYSAEAADIEVAGLKRIHEVLGQYIGQIEGQILLVKEARAKGLEEKKKKASEIAVDTQQ